MNDAWLRLAAQEFSLTIYTNFMNKQCFLTQFTNDKHPKPKESWHQLDINKYNVESIPYDSIDELTPNSDFVKPTTS
jgi:hypothetical protein